MVNKKGGDDDGTSSKGKFPKESMFKNSKGVSGGGAGGRAPNVGKDAQAVPFSSEAEAPKETFADKAREMIKNQRRESRAKTARLLMEGSQMKTRTTNTQDTAVPYANRPTVDDPKCDINPKTGKRWKTGEREEIEAEEKSEKSKFENRHRKKSQAEAFVVMKEGDIMKTRAVNKESTVVPYNSRPVADCLNCGKDKKGNKNQGGDDKKQRSKEKIKPKSTNSWANPKGVSTPKSNSKVPEKAKAETNLASSKNTDSKKDKVSESNKPNSKK